MPKITYIQPDGVARDVDVAAGRSVMEGAIHADVHGIIAECGGACACATCQVYVDEAWAARVGTPGPLELSMIEDAESDRPHLRLSCQIQATDALDGLVVHVASKQR